MEQKSKEWFAARKSKLTGSNVGAALGLNPYKTPADLIRQMVREHHGAAPEFVGNIATEYGAGHEPLAMMDYLGKTGNHAVECGFFVHHKYDWLGASPDGLINDDGLVEVKCPFSLRNKEGKDLAFKTIGEQPGYYAQIQTELHCTGRAWCDFYQWTANGDSVERVYISEQWLDDNIPKLRLFYERFLSEIENPAHLEPKQVEIDNHLAKKMIEEWDSLSAVIDDATARKKELLAELVEISKERNAIISGRKLTKVERVGNVQYNKVPELQGVDLEQYRGKSSTFWKLS